MNVLLFVVGAVDLDFIPRYVVPAIVVIMTLIIVGGYVREHFEILRSQKAQVPQNGNEPTESAQLEPVGSDDWTYPSFFTCHAHDSSRLRIDTDVIHALVGDDLRRLTDDERWFVEWYHAERKKGMTHFSTFGSLGLPDAPQAEVCKELRAMLTAQTLEDKDIF